MPAACRCTSFPNDLPGGGDGLLRLHPRSESDREQAGARSRRRASPALGLVTPDYVIPNGFLPTAGGTVNYADVDQVTYIVAADRRRARDQRHGADDPEPGDQFRRRVGVGGAGRLRRRARGQLRRPVVERRRPDRSRAGASTSRTRATSIFATWFTYDLTGKALVAGHDRQQDRPTDVYTGTLYQTHGPAFSAVPFNPGRRDRDRGRDRHADLHRRQQRQLRVHGQRHHARPRRSRGRCSGRCRPARSARSRTWRSATNYQDLWWAAPAESESGWGVNFTHQGDMIFATWFTYDVDGTPLWLSATVHQDGAGRLHRDAVPDDRPGVQRGAVRSRERRSRRRWAR